MFVDPDNYNYSLAWDERGPSPCIDSGNPNSRPDPDGTRADMGYKYFPHVVETYIFKHDDFNDGWNWKGFPVTDNVSYKGDNDPYNDNDNLYNFMFPLISTLALAQVDYQTVDNGTAYLQHFYPTNNSDYIIDRTLGYKVKVTQSAELHVSGFRIDPDEPISVPVKFQEYWITYTPKYNKIPVFVAFGDFIDHLYSIKTQNWCMKRTEQNAQAPWIIESLEKIPLLNYGDLVGVCRFDEKPETFQWTYGAPAQGYSRKYPEFFTYQEDSDYLPIYLEIDPQNTPDEIGIYVNGQCKGAVVVEDSLEQINAYVLSEDPESEITIVCHYQNKNQSYMAATTIYDKITGFYVKDKLCRSNKDFLYLSMNPNSQETTVSPITLSLSNYPNPFNPNTTIIYCLTKKTDVNIKILNTKGQLIRNWKFYEALPGNNSIIWDGKDSEMKQVASGLYFVRLETNHGTKTLKTMLIK